jgi:hypothetical protein
MTASLLTRAQLRLCIPPESLGFADTSELVQHPSPWIGQERAEKAARFGLAMEQPDYNLFVLGEVGSGRSTLLHQVAKEVAANRPVPPDLCYLHNFDTPERPRALRMPPGQGRQLRQLMVQFVHTIQTEIPVRLGSEDFKTESERVHATYKREESKAYAELDAFAEARHFTLFREQGHLVFTLIGDKGLALTEGEARALPKDRRAEIDLAEQELRGEIARFLEKMRPLERIKNEALAALRRQVVKPLLDHELQEIRISLKKQIKDSVKLGSFLDQVQHNVLEQLDLFTPNEEGDEETEAERRIALAQLLARCSVNVVVDNTDRVGAPVIMEHNPVFRALFGSIEFQAEEDVLMTDFTRIRAGSLLKAHGGFLLLHLRDLLADELVWEKLRRLLAQRAGADRRTRHRHDAHGHRIAGARGGGCRRQNHFDWFGRALLRGAGSVTPNLRGAFASRSTLPRVLPPARPPAKVLPCLWPTPAGAWGYPIFPAQRWRGCWRTPTARWTTKPARAPSLPAPKRWWPRVRPCAAPVVANAWKPGC